jgi:hypothetical protein
VSPRAIRPSEDLDRGASPVKLRMMHLSNRLAGLQDELDAEKKVCPTLILFLAAHAGQRLPAGRGDGG